MALGMLPADWQGKRGLLAWGGCWGHLWVGGAGSCWDGASPHLPQSSQHSGPHVGSALQPGHQADSVTAQAQVAWNGTPTPSHTIYVPAQPVIINSPPERPSPSGIKQGGVLVWLSHGKNQETTSAEEQNVLSSLARTELIRCDLRCPHLAVARLFLPRIQFHLLLPNNK